LKTGALKKKVSRTCIMKENFSLCTQHQNIYQRPLRRTLVLKQNYSTKTNKMTDMFESSEAFTAHLIISTGYYMIEQAQIELDKETEILPIERMIDAATGADKERLDNHKRFIAMCLIDIIEAKKVIKADYSKDAEFLALLNSNLNDERSVASKAQ
jgi:hypothetical protein